MLSITLFLPPPPPHPRSSPLPIVFHNSLLVIKHYESARAVEVVFRGRLIF